MKKLIFSILPAFLFAFISCMNMSSGSGENGSVRVALPGSGRATYTYSKNNADKFIVRLYNDDFDQTEDGTVGGVIEFPDLEPGKYTATAEAWNTDENILEGSGSTKITVKAGETTDCSITMILEGQTAYYSKYMLFSDSDDNMYAYDYLTCAEKKKWDFANNNPCLYFAESSDGSIYYVQEYYNSSQSALTDYYSYKYDFNTTTSKSTKLNGTNQGFFDGYYDSTTDIYWVIREAVDSNNLSSYTLYLYKDGSGYNTGIIRNGFGNCAIRGENLYYSFGDDSIGYATFDYTTSGGSANEIETKTLADFYVSGKINDIAVLEDGRVAVLVCDTSSYPSNDSNNQTVIYNYNVANNSTVTSRGALLILSSDLSLIKTLGWSGERTISATGSSSGYKITANIPKYEERNSHFYGPMRIVAIRPKELVIADCGANFVLPDYDGKKNGKMYAHNRLMTVNLRNFAIGCKKEFTEDEIKFQNLAVSGSLTVVSSGTDGWSDGSEK